MTKPATMVRNSAIFCAECEETIFETPKTMELSATSGKYFRPGQVPGDEISQGLFDFCHSCTPRHGRRIVRS